MLNRFKMTNSLAKLALAAAISLALGGLPACGDSVDEPDVDSTDPTETNPGTQAPIQCGSAEYIAFDAAHHENQDLRLGAYVGMLDLMNAAKSDPTLAPANFAEAEDLYINTASLQTKVQGRTDDHFEDRPMRGAELDATILAGLAAGRVATTTLEVNLAKQAVDKTMIEFFFLSVYHELVAGTRKNWDEAYGYFGSGYTNSESDLRGFAKVAFKRDSGNGTTFGSEIFNALIDGSCELGKALEAAGEDSVDVSTVPALQAAIDTIDGAMQRVLAHSAGHEALGMISNKASLVATPDDQAVKDNMWVKLAELDPYFKPLEVLMSSSRAEAIRAEIDVGLNANDESWMDIIDAQAIISHLEAEYSITIVD